jgi:hypothetical protein
MLLRHLALAVTDETRSREFYEPPQLPAFLPDYVSVKVRDPDGYVVEACWDKP